MDAFTVEDLRERTGEVIQCAEAGHLVVVTKRGQPVFIAVPFDEQLIRLGVNCRLAIEFYKKEIISIGQAAKIAGMTYEAFMDLLGKEGLAVVEYDPQDLEKELESMSS